MRKLHAYNNADFQGPVPDFRGDAGPPAPLGTTVMLKVSNQIYTQYYIYFKYNIYSNT